MKRLFGFFLAAMLVVSCTTTSFAVDSVTDEIDGQDAASVISTNDWQDITDSTPTESIQSGSIIDLKDSEMDTVFAESKQIALNALPMHGFSADWEIVQETELYGWNNTVIGYCFDVKNPAPEDDEDPETAYVMVDTDENEFPLYLYGIDGVSPYYGQLFDKAYYLGPLSYFAESNDSIVNLQTGEQVSREDFNTALAEGALTTADENYFPEEDFTSIRQDYIAGTMPIKASETGSVDYAANFQWTRGCAPTTIAMLIASHFRVLNADTLINTLADHMGTASNGTTSFAGIRSGSQEYFRRGTLEAPVINTWYSMQSNGTPNVGLSKNPLSVFQTSIDYNFPVGVYCASSNVITPGFSDGINSAHMMAGIGYSFGSSGNFITCYTTYQKDGAVSFPVTSNGLKNPAWYLMNWQVS